ncbi:MAG: BTAD domain-containing putative transcriptional regulator [Pseudonocardia sp.]
MAETRLRLLGRFQVLRAAEEVPPARFGGRKARALVRVLAVRAPDLVSHDALAEALWPDRLPADPAGNLGVLVNRVRRAVEDPHLVVTGTGGYGLGPCTVDVAEFLGALGVARDADDPARALRAARAALALWGEPLAEDAYADWARDPRERLLRARVDALEIVAGCELALGNAAAAVASALDAVAADPLRESATVVLVRALAAAGDPAGALARLAQLRARLADELGVDPSPATTELQLALLRGGPPAPVRLGTPPPPAARETGFSGLPFVGRDRELAALRCAVEAGELVAVSGMAGVGKSRLLAEALRGSRRPVIQARAFLPERAEAWGLARSLLREAHGLDTGALDTLPPRLRSALAELLPDLDPNLPAAPEPAPGSDDSAPGVADPAAPEPAAGAVDPALDRLDPESRRALRLAGALRLLRAVTGPGAVLVIDDLQWADPSSVALVGSVLARLPELAGVLAFRAGELATGVLTDLAGSRPCTEIALGPLPPVAVTGLTADPGLGAALVEATDGTPFAIAEVLRELAARDAVFPGPAGWECREPAAATLAAELGRTGQARAIRRRVGRLPAASAEVLAGLSLLARETPAHTVAAACGLASRAALDVLSALNADGLVRLGETGWATAHDLVAETVVGELADGERGRLHGLLAAALAAEDADPSEVARHHREAGDTASATDAFGRAARRALDGHATREAAELAGAGLALRPREPVRGELLDVQAEARAVHGDLAGAAADLKAALAEPGPGRSRRLARLAMLISGARDPRLAAELAELAIVEAGHDDRQRAEALETAAILDMNLGQPERARARAEEALALYRAHGDSRGTARILDGRAMATFLDGRIREGVEVFDRVARLCEDAGELLRVVTPRSTGGHGLVFLGRPEDALRETDAALRLARELDAPEGQAYSLWHRSEALSGLGRVAEAEADAREGLRIAEGIQHRGWTATAHRALGIALQTGGMLDDAAAAFARSGEVAGDALTLFASWACARTASVAVALGALSEADSAVRRALALGPPLGHYEARQARVELAVARGEDVTARASSALALARAGGHLVSARRLAALAAGS